MNTPEQHDPMHDLFDEYAETTLAETRPRAVAQLRRNVFRRRVGRTAVAGAAVAVLAVPAGWALQNAGAADQGSAPAGPGPTSAAESRCVPGGRYVLLAEDVTVDDYLAGMEADASVIVSDRSVVEFAASPDLFAMVEGAAEWDGETYSEIDDGSALVGSEGSFLVELYGNFEEGGSVELLYPCEEEPTEGTGAPAAPADADEEAEGERPTGDAEEEASTEEDGGASSEAPTPGGDESEEVRPTP